VETVSVEIDKLSIKIEQVDSSGSKSLEKLSSSLEKMAVNSSKSIKNITSSLEKLQKVLDKFSNGQIDKIERLSKALSGLNSDIKTPKLGSFANSIKKISDADIPKFESGLKNITDALKQMNAEVSANSGLKELISDLAIISRNAATAGRNLKNVTNNSASNTTGTTNSPVVDVNSSAQATNNLGNVLNNTFSGASEFISNATSRIRDFTSGLRSASGTATKLGSGITSGVSAILHPFRTASTLFNTMKNGLSGITGGFRKASGAANGLSNNLLSVIARSVKYSLIYRSINLIISSVSGGILNLYYANTQFAASMDRCATEAQYLQNSIAAALSPAIEALTPVVEFVVDKFVDLINVVNMCIATITGQSTWTRAVKAPTTYADALDNASSSASDAANATKDATDAANEYKRTLMGFDEIEKLNDVTSSSASGSNGGSGGSAGSSTPDYSSMFTTEQVALDSTEFGAALQDFINAIKDEIAAGDWEGVGTTLAGGFGQAVDYLDEFVTSEKVKKKVNTAVDNLTDVINGFFEEMTYSDGTKQSIATRTGDLIGDAMSLALNDTDRFFTKVKWSKIGEAVAQGVNGAIESLNENDIKFGTVLADILNAGIKGLDGFTSDIKWSKVGQFIADNINSFFSTVDWSTAGKDAHDLITGLCDMLSTAVTNIDSEEIRTALSEFLTALDPLDCVISIGKLILDFTGSVIDLLFGGSGDSAGFDDYVSQAVEQSTKSAALTIDVDTIASDYSQVGGKIGNGLTSGITGSVGSSDWVTEATGKLKTAAQTLKDSVSEKIEIVASFVTNVADNSQTWWDNVKQWWSNKVGSVKNFTTNVANNSQTWWNNVKQWWSDKVGSVKNFTTNVANNSQTWWNNVKQWWSDKVKGKALSVSVSVVNSAKSWWEKVKGWWDEKTKNLNLSTKLGIKVPKISVNWSETTFLGKTFKYPTSFNVKWNAKGGILNGAQLFGMAGNTLLGGGEAGQEAVLPLESNTGWMDKIADKVANKVSNSDNERPIQINLTIEQDGTIVAKKVINYINGEAKRTGINPLSAYI
jgi:hypothetical protein